jgi:pilus assembly protein CpaE
VALNITLIGSTDRQLEEMLRGPSVRLKMIHVSDLLALAQPSAQQPDVVMLDVRNSNALPPTLASMKRQHPTTGIIIVGSRLDPSLMLEAMRAGVNEWLAEPFTAGELQSAIDRVCATGVARPSGQVFAFVGAKGGVGTTTTAVNVAAALARASDEQTLFMDLHLAYGDAAVFLGAEPRFSVADAMENTHRLDEAFFESLVVQTKAKVHLLASSERTVGSVDIRRVPTLLQFAAGHYRYTFLDLPRSEAVILDSIEGASTIVIVANQELATVRNAGRMATALRQRYGKERVRVVISRYDKSAEIGREDVERVVGSPVTHLVPSDYRLALQALNKGRPLSLDMTTKLAEAYRDLAFDLGGVQAAPAAESQRAGGLLSRITGRR